MRLPQYSKEVSYVQVLPNVPQSRLKNQPRLEQVGSGAAFDQEELFIFHSTLTELQASS
jgi:hypothetical protein